MLDRPDTTPNRYLPYNNSSTNLNINVIIGCQIVRCFSINGNHANHTLKIEIFQPVFLWITRCPRDPKITLISPEDADTKPGQKHQ